MMNSQHIKMSLMAGLLTMATALPAVKVINRTGYDLSVQFYEVERVTGYLFLDCILGCVEGELTDPVTLSAGDILRQDRPNLRLAQVRLQRGDEHEGLLSCARRMKHEMQGLGRLHRYPMRDDRTYVFYHHRGADGSIRCRQG